jgi:MFS family permease
MFGFFFLVLQFLQLQLGYSPLKSALAILPLAITMFPLSTVAAVVAERRGMRLITTLGLIIGALAFVYLATLDAGSSYWHLLPGLLATGAGVALAMSPATNAIVSALPPSKQGVASAVNDTARELGAALGVAILGSAFNAGYRNDIDSVASRLPPRLAEPVRDAPATALGVAKQVGPAGRALVDAVHDGFAVGMRWALVVGAGLLVLTAIYTWAQAPGRTNRSDVQPTGPD